MKKLLFLLVTLLSLSAFGQTKGVIVTHYFSTQRMVWSDVDNEWLFFDNDDLTRRSCQWNFTLEDDGSGTVYMEELIKDGDEYELVIYDWNITPIGDCDGIDSKFIQKIDGQKGSVMIQKCIVGGVAKHAISIFLPETQLFIYFDNFQHD